MYNLRLLKTIFFVIAYCTLQEMAFANSEFACKEALQQIEISPLESTLAQLNARIARLSHTLSLTNNQTQRQFKKLSNQLRSIVENFVKSGDISDKDLEKMMSLALELLKLEERFLDIEQAALIDPLELRRYLFTEEVLKPDVDYTANIPGFDRVNIRFTKEIASLFSSSNTHRKLSFPYLFNGQVGKRAQDGIKDFVAGTNTKTVNGIEYKLMELKTMHTSGSRVLIVYIEAENLLHFYKFISNHHRIEYMSKGDFLGSYLKAHLQDPQ